MSFAGHALNAIKIVRANRALSKKKSFFKDAAFDPKWDKTKTFHIKVPTAVEKQANSEKNLSYLAEEKRKQKAGLIKAILITAIFMVALAYFIRPIFT